MGQVGETHYRCAFCLETYPRTPEHFFFDRTGRVTGYCRHGCHRAWWKDYWTTAGAYQRAQHRLSSRLSNRRRNAIPPDRYRVPDAQEAT